MRTREIKPEMLPLTAQPGPKATEQLEKWFGFKPPVAIIKEVRPSTDPKYHDVYVDVLRNLDGDPLGYHERIQIPGYATFKQLEVKALIQRQRYQLHRLGALKYDFYRIFATGADPEMFVVNGSGEIIPSWKFLPAKAAALKVMAGYGNAGYTSSVYWDGFQAELAPYASCCHAWTVDALFNGLAVLLQQARKFDANAKLSMQTVLEIPAKLRLEATDQHIALGCKPSFNAYGAQPKHNLADGRKLAHRCTGGHIHFGCGQLTPKQVETSVKTLDRLLGIAYVSLFANFDSPLRREMYGLAGEHRLPTHGLEYRTLSNMWLCHPAITMLTFDWARQVLAYSFSAAAHTLKGDDTEVQGIINSCDYKAARQWLKTNEAHYFATLCAAYHNGRYEYGRGAVDSAWKLFTEGIESGVKDPTDVESNWGLRQDNCRWRNHSEGDLCQWRTASAHLTNGNLL